jgi:hypothetical protein
MELLLQGQPCVQLLGRHEEPPADCCWMVRHWMLGRLPLLLPDTLLTCVQQLEAVGACLFWVCDDEVQHQGCAMTRCNISSSQCQQQAETEAGR